MLTTDFIELADDLMGFVSLLESHYGLKFSLCPTVGQQGVVGEAVHTKLKGFGSDITFQMTADDFALCLEVIALLQEHNAIVNLYRTSSSVAGEGARNLIGLLAESKVADLGNMLSERSLIA